jgi:hypothetical protein
MGQVRDEQRVGARRIWRVSSERELECRHEPATPRASGETRVVNGEVQILSAQKWSYSAGLNASVGLFEAGAHLFNCNSHMPRLMPPRSASSSSAASRP